MRLSRITFILLGTFLCSCQSLPKAGEPNKVKDEVSKTESAAVRRIKAIQELRKSCLAYSKVLKDETAVTNALIAEYGLKLDRSLAELRTYEREFRLRENELMNLLQSDDFSKTEDTPQRKKADGGQVK